MLADITFHCDTDNLALMMFGRLDASDAIAHGKLQAESDKKPASSISASRGSQEHFAKGIP
ncbi:MAG: hypothetical protein O2913_11540 [Chloroflexi bacterium]|nr:hypothetical protein [Chloroflexota bacterium]